MLQCVVSFMTRRGSYASFLDEPRLAPLRAQTRAARRSKVTAWIVRPFLLYTWLCFVQLKSAKNTGYGLQGAGYGVLGTGY